MLVVLLAGLLLAASGCGPHYHPVSGRITLDKQPLADAGVMFHPKAAGPVGSAVTDANGNFQLVMANHSGALAGDYVVTVIKQKVTGVRSDESVEPEGVRTEWLTPERYSKRDSSPLKATVPADSARYDFALSVK